MVCTNTWYGRGFHSQYRHFSFPPPSSEIRAVTRLRDLPEPIATPILIAPPHRCSVRNASNEELACYQRGRHLYFPHRSR